MTITSTSQTYTANKLTAAKATTAYESTVASKPVDRMDNMKEKYKDVYTPIPETYSKADEDLQTQKIHEAYPDYVDFRNFFKILSTLEDGRPIQLGQELTSQQQENIQSKKNKFYENFGGEESFHNMQKGVQEIRDKYPVNEAGKDPSIYNATEMARFRNAAIYEGLEDGKTLEEAKINSNNLLATFMDTQPNKQFHETLVKAGRAKANSYNTVDFKNEIDFNATNNSTMDLRKYGIKGSWEYHKIYENQQTMTSEIEKKINQFNFMLNNEDKIKEAYSKLDSSYQDLGNNAGYKRMIEEKYMPMMEEGLNIFENYKIYDSIDIKG